jgi:predicted Zn-dependent peptidase
MIQTNIDVKENKQFTTASLGCFLRLPLTKHNLAYASLLAKIQESGSLYYPGPAFQLTRLAELYDLHLHIFPQVFGKQLVLTYTLNFIEPDELLDPDYSYDEIVKTFSQIVTEPLIKEPLLTWAKQQLVEEHEQLQANPESYALERFFQLWYQKQADYAASYIGDIEAIKAADAEQLKLFADSLRPVPAQVSAFCRHPKQLTELLTASFKLAGIMKVFSPQDAERVIPAPAISVDESEDRHNLQTQLFLGYGYQLPDLKRQLAANLLCQYLAGDAAAKLFTTVREQLGAAYAVEANNYLNNSVFVINLGVNPEKVQKASAICQQEIAKVQAGDLDWDLFKHSKKALLAGIKISGDNIMTLLARELQGKMCPQYEHLDRIAACQKITAQEMISFSRGLSLKESYQLK